MADEIREFIAEHEADPEDEAGRVMPAKEIGRIAMPDREAFFRDSVSPAAARRHPTASSMVWILEISCPSKRSIVWHKTGTSADSTASRLTRLCSVSSRSIARD